MTPMVSSSLGTLICFVAVTLLVGCEQPPEPLKSRESAAIDPPTRSVRYSEIPHDVAIIGKLGRPLWKLVTIEGKWMPPGLEKPSLPPTFAVTKVNGRDVKGLIEFDVIEPVNRVNERFAKSVEGEVWELRGVETGGFVGFSDEVDEDLGLQPASHPPRGF